ncbi:MAG: type II toxin-antitoxin system HicA family toxin, partial [Candidatus Limnocylindrales bacterium]
PGRPRMPFTARQLRTALGRAGFLELRQHGSHLILRRHERDGRIRRLTIPIHHGDVKAGTLEDILREAGMTEDDLRRLLRG